MSEIVLLGLGVAASPLAVIAVVLMLATPDGRRSGVAFLLAWVLALATVGTVVVLVADVADADDAGKPATWVSVVKLIVAATLSYVAAGQWRARPTGDEEPALPSFLSGVEAFGPRKAAGLALVLAAVKPKNLLLTVAAGVAVAQTGAAAATQALALGAFVLLGALAPGVPVLVGLTGGAGGQQRLERARGWLILRNAVITAVLCLVIAVKLAIDAVGSLVA